MEISNIAQPYLQKFLLTNCGDQHILVLIFIGYSFILEDTFIQNVGIVSREWYLYLYGYQ